jgi:CubicO group peptidase (beta-lactamase class C family)
MPVLPVLNSITALLAATSLDAAVAQTGVGRAALLVGRGDDVIQRRCWPDEHSCSAEYDLASLTKPITAIAVLGLGVRLDDLVRKHLPAFERSEPITIRQLIEHTSRLPPVVKVADLPPGLPDVVLERIVYSRLRKGPVYGDLNYVVAGRLVEQVTGRRLDAVVEEQLLAPLKMNETTWTPSHAAPNGAQRGTPHDPIARVCMSAASAPGHAGLFSTVDDLGKLMRGIVGDAPQLDLLRAELRRGGSAGWSAWSNGWGKTGWTGTFLWFDLSTRRWAVFLSNRTDGDHGFIDFDLVVAEAGR